ncbi:MAG: VOC family protein [Micrococcales bacterium]|nr:VOC family protein [Micrococcales bacterium]
MITKRGISPFFTLNGTAEQAMNYYAANLPGAQITSLERFGKDHPFAEPAEQNKVRHGSINFMGQELMFMDMDAAHPAPDLIWSTSVLVACQDEAEFDAIFGALSNGGAVMMGPEPVPPLRKVAWVTDQFGVTWQPVWE